MKEYILSEWIFFVGIFLFLFLSIICQLILIYHLRKLVNESQSLEEGKAQIMDAWIEEYLMEVKKIVNIPVFVDKKIQQISIGKMTLVKWKHLSGQLLLGMIFLAGMGACVGIVQGKTLGEILPFYVISIIGLYFHISLSAIIDLEEKTNRIRMNVIDYLENGKAYEYRKKEEIENNESYFEEDLELMDIIREILA